MMAVGDRRRALPAGRSQISGREKTSKVGKRTKADKLPYRETDATECVGNSYARAEEEQRDRRFPLVIRVVPCFFPERLRFGECDSNAGNGSDASFPFANARFEKPSRFLTNLSFAWNPDHFVITKHSFIVIV